MFSGHLLGIPVTKSKKTQFETALKTRYENDKLLPLLDSILGVFNNKAAAGMQFSGVSAAVIISVSTERNFLVNLGIALMLIGCLFFISIIWVSWGKADNYIKQEEEINRTFQLCFYRGFMLNFGLFISMLGLAIAALGNFVT